MIQCVALRHVVMYSLSCELVAGLLFAGCMRAPEWVRNPAPDDSAAAVPASDHAVIATGFLDDQDRTDAPSVPLDDDWHVLRVGGDFDAQISGENGDWRYALSRVDTELPEGYPPPTPPGAIELKKYAEVRRAEVSGRLNPNLGMNLGFWPLFQHIQRNDIAMTAPVEMNTVAGMDQSVARRVGRCLSCIEPPTSVRLARMDGYVSSIPSR